MSLLVWLQPSLMHQFDPDQGTELPALLCMVIRLLYPEAICENTHCWNAKGLPILTTIVTQSWQRDVHKIRAWGLRL